MQLSTREGSSRVCVRVCVRDSLCLCCLTLLWTLSSCRLPVVVPPFAPFPAPCLALRQPELPPSFGRRRNSTQLDSTQLCERKTRPLIISGSSFRFAFLGNAFLGSFRFWFLFCFFCFFVQFISFVLFSSISGGTIKKHGRTTSQNVPRFVPLLFLYISCYFLCTFYSGFCCLFTFRNKENK